MVESNQAACALAQKDDGGVGGALAVEHDILHTVYRLDAHGRRVETLGVCPVIGIEEAVG